MSLKLVYDKLSVVIANAEAAPSAVLTPMQALIDDADDDPAVLRDSLKEIVKLPEFSACPVPMQRAVKMVIPLLG